MTTVFDGKMLIDGELVESVSGERFDSVNPVNEELIGTVPRANADDGVELALVRPGLAKANSDALR